MSQPAFPDITDLRITTGTEGPREDPYGWTLYSVTMADGWRGTLRTSALCGSRYTSTVDGLGTVIAVGNQAERSFEAAVGHRLYELEEEFFGADDSDIREAELAAGWDPNP